MTVHDVHAHIVPRGLVDDLRRHGARHGVELVREDGLEHLRFDGRVASKPLRAPFLDVDDRLAHMDRTGVDVQWISPWADTAAYELSRDDATEYCRWYNDHLATIMADHPGRFLALANVPLRHPEQAAEELRRAVVDLGMPGCEITTTVDGDDLDDPDLEPFWEAAADLRCLVLLHPFRSLKGRGVSRWFTNNMIGNPAESTVAAAHVILSGVLERNPDLRVGLVHGGGFLPYQLGRLDRGYRMNPDVAGARLTRAPSEWARELLYDTVTHSSPAIRFLIDTVGATQVVLGTDHPFEMGDDDPTATIDAIPGLTADERRLILSDNVQGLLDGIRR